MRVLQIGMAKSGNYWVWRILQALLRLAGESPRSFIRTQPAFDILRDLDLSFPEQAYVDCIDVVPGGLFSQVYPVYSMPIEDWASYCEATNHVWSHSEFCSDMRDVIRSFDRTFYVVRDPRDIIISMAHFDATDFKRRFYGGLDQPIGERLAENARSRPAQWAQHVRGYLPRARDLGIHVVFYERLVREFDLEVRGLAAALGLRLGSTDLESIRHDVSIDLMRRDAPGHVRCGAPGRWRTELPEPLKQRVTAQLAPLLSDLGYSIDPSDEATDESLPSMDGLDLNADQRG